MDVLKKQLAEKERVLIAKERLIKTLEQNLKYQYDRNEWLWSYCDNLCARIKSTQDTGIDTKLSGSYLKVVK